MEWNHCIKSVCGHARIQKFSSGGGGGVSGQSDQKKLWQPFFSPQLVLQKSNGQFQRNLSFIKVQEGSNIFQGGGGGVQLFPGDGNPIAYSI